MPSRSRFSRKTLGIVGLVALAVITLVFVVAALTLPQAAQQTSTYAPPNMLDQMFDLFFDR